HRAPGRPAAPARSAVRVGDAVISAAIRRDGLRIDVAGLRPTPEDVEVMVRLIAKALQTR
ncbi:MAG: hypothetical protein ACK4WC_09425, partial [Rubrimonas sp.]